MSCRTKEPFSSGSVPCALTIILQLILCAVSVELICVQHSVLYLPFPPVLPVPLSSSPVVCQSVYHFLLIHVTVFPVPFLFPTYLLWAHNRVPQGSWLCWLPDPVGKAWSQSCLSLWEGKSAASHSPLLNHPFAQNLQDDNIFAISMLLPDLVEIRFHRYWCRESTRHITRRQLLRKS